MTYLGYTNGTNYDLGRLELGSNYVWRIDATNEIGTATGDIWTFNTIAPPLGKATSPSPANGAIEVDPINTVLYWTPGLYNGEPWYNMQTLSFGLAGNMTDLGWDVSSYQWGYAVYQDVFYPDGMPAGSQMEWQVFTKLYNPGTGELWATATGDVWTFTVAMGKAINPFPADTAILQPTNTIVSWANGGGALGYEIWFGLSGDMTNCGTTTTTNYECGELVEGSTYEWRIDSTNSVETKTGNVWTFYYFPVRYFSHGDGTVTDMKTGLMWLKQSNTGNMDWETGKSYCSNLVFAGYSDWRLPSMGMACDRETGDPYELDTLGWADGIPNTTWEGMTGTPFSGLEDFSWYMSRSTLDTEEILEYCDYFIEDGSTGTFGIQNGEAVWPVRGGE